MLPVIYQAFKGFRLSINGKLWTELIQYAFPLLIMGLAGVTNEMLSRAMLKKLLPDGFYSNYSNLAALGIFGACYKLSIFMNLAVQAFRYAAEPFFFSKSETKDSKSEFARVLTGFTIFGSFVFLFISLNLWWIAPIFLRSEIYLEGLEVVPVLLLANLFLGINFNLSIWYKLSDKTGYGALIAISGAIITIGFNILLIPEFGYTGSAYVTLLSYVSMSVFSYALGRAMFPIPYQTGKVLGYIFLAILLYSIGTMVNLSGISAFILNEFLILLLVLFVLFFERRFIKDFRR
jgi:O-antigen/teichoic acid export membrane protein